MSSAVLDRTHFNGLWEDEAGRTKQIAGIKSFGFGPQAAKLIDVKTKNEDAFVVTQVDECKMNFGTIPVEGKRTTDGQMILWGNGSVWVKKEQKEDTVQDQPAKSKPSAAKAKRNIPQLSLEQALEMQEELCRGFSDPVFQMRLKEIEKTYGKAYEETTPKHSKLFLSVQSEVLPKYGFAGTQEGVIDMLEAAAVHNRDQNFRAKRQELHLLLGLEPAKDELVASQAAPKGAGKGGYAASKAMPMPRVSDLPAAAAQLRNPLSSSVLEKPKPKIDSTPTEVIVRHAVDDSEVKVTVPGDSNFLALKEAVGRKLHRTDWAERARLVGRENGSFFAYKDTEQLDGVCLVMVLSVDLEAAERPRSRKSNAR